WGYRRWAKKSSGGACSRDYKTRENWGLSADFFEYFDFSFLDASFVVRTPKITISILEYFPWAGKLHEFQPRPRLRLTRVTKCPKRGKGVPMKQLLALAVQIVALGNLANVTAAAEILYSADSATPAVENDAKPNPLPKDVIPSPMPSGDGIKSGKAP